MALALLLALSVAALAMHRWLGGFAYRTAFPWEALLLGGAGALGLAVLTVAVHTLRAATADPVEALRGE